MQTPVERRKLRIQIPICRHRKSKMKIRSPAIKFMIKVTEIQKEAGITDWQKTDWEGKRTL